MSLREFTDTIDAEMRTVIEAELARIETERGVTILFAVESGSRAWGFPSPDSDYDVRFVYAHPTEWYLRIFPGKGFIELPIDDELDINGWDLRKALGLLIKPNPVLLEWLSSPIRYRWNNAVCDALISFSRKASHRTACLHHYMSLGRSQWRRHIGGKDQINLKKYFYALRPAMAIRWVRMYPDTPPPMNLQEMVSGIELDAKVIDWIGQLIELKSRTRETGLGERNAAINSLILSELDWAEATAKNKPNHHLVDEADQLFRRLLAQSDTL